jgi:hypothetical protein
MGFFVFVFVVCVIIFMVFIFMGNADHERVQKEIANSMYGEPEQDVPVLDVEKECARIEALIQASESGHDDVHQQIEDGTYTGPWPERRSDGAWTSIFDDLRILSIAGINHRSNIVRYKGRNMIALVPEPSNEFDPDAIKVVAEDGHHLGYIHRDQTDMVRSWAHNYFPHYCVAMVLEHDDEDDGHRFYTGYIYFIKTKLQNEKVSNVGDGGGLDTHRL